MSKFRTWLSSKFKCSELPWIPYARDVKEWVESKSEEIAEEIFWEIYENIEDENIRKKILNEEPLTEKEKEVVEKILEEKDYLVHEAVDGLLTYDFDNIIIADAYAGEYEPSTLTEVPKTIHEYARAFAYEVWEDKIWSKLRKKLMLE